MTMTKPTIVRESDAKVFYEGPELCREYLRNDDLWFGSSLVQPGETGAVDTGHADSWEIFYCVAGEGIIDDGENEYPLSAGDTLAIPPTIPHRIHNRGTEPVLMVLAGGPGENVA
ncbi:cupin domain-containing protein [Rhodococcus koreensis]